MSDNITISWHREFELLNETLKHAIGVQYVSVFSARHYHTFDGVEIGPLGIGCKAEDTVFPEADFPDISIEGMQIAAMEWEKRNATLKQANFYQEGAIDDVIDV